MDAAAKQEIPGKPKDKLKIIDAAAGTGLIGVELHRLGYSDLHALDISQEMLNEAMNKNVYKTLICAALSDQQIPEIETGTFDALICGGALFMGHVRPSAFGEMIRLVKSGKPITWSIINISNEMAMVNCVVSRDIFTSDAVFWRALRASQNTRKE